MGKKGDELCITVKSFAEAGKKREKGGSKLRCFRPLSRLLTQEESVLERHDPQLMNHA